MPRHDHLLAMPAAGLAVFLIGGFLVTEICLAARTISEPGAVREMRP